MFPFVYMYVVTICWNQFTVLTRPDKTYTSIFLCTKNYQTTSITILSCKFVFLADHFSLQLKK
jgi:hypothetical protein